MYQRRIVITGVGVVSPFGYGVQELMDGVASGKCATQYMDDWADYGSLHSKVAAPVTMRDERRIPRQFRRTMSPMSIFAAQAAQQVLADTGLSREDVAADPRIGCIMGHTTGSPQTITDTYDTLAESRDLGLVTASNFFRCLSHTVTLNIAQYLGISGFVMATSAACASSLQAIGTGFDLIRTGRQDAVFCGGGEELHPTVTGSFDILFATSEKYNETPSRTPRPFDRDRDGLVCGEGAGVVLLEEYEHARGRGAHIYAEVTGYHSCGNGSHVSQSNPESMRWCMQEVLTESGLSPCDIDYVNAHATATEQGDTAEARAIAELFGATVPVSSLKGYFGHTLGASSVIELIASLIMMERERIYPTHNLENVDSQCSGIEHLLEYRDCRVDHLMKNSFAFGGINAALVCSRFKSKRG